MQMEKPPVFGQGIDARARLQPFLAFSLRAYSYQPLFPEQIQRQHAVPVAILHNISTCTDLLQRQTIIQNQFQASLDVLNQDYYAHALPDGAEAVEKFQRSAPYSVDAILMDMQMPVLDGCGAARAIRRLDRPDAAVVPIVAVTANAFAEDVDRTTAAGMNAHVSKPIDMDRLLEALALCWAGKTPPAAAPGE